jgi:molecular chaperone HscB
MLAQTPLACADCQSLLEHISGADYFELFGLPRRYDLDADVLHGTFLAIARNTHPDAFATADPRTQSLMLRIAAAVNRAYETLRDPVLRAGYLLESYGGKSAADDKRVPPDLLARVMTLREQIEEAKAGGDTATLDEVRRAVAVERDAALRHICELCQRLADDDPAVRDDLRMQLNAMKYYDNLLGQL